MRRVALSVWNDKAAAVIGYSKEDALGRNMLDMVGHSHPDDGVGKLFRNSMTTKGELIFKIKLRTKVWGISTSGVNVHGAIQSWGTTYRNGVFGIRCN
jgi:PAS domain-containing protein